MQQVQQALKKQDRSITLGPIIWVATFFGVCIILALAGVIMGVIIFTSHTNIPAWMQVCWIVVNILLTLILGTLWIMFYVLAGARTDQNSMNLFVGVLFTMGIGCVICVMDNFLSFQSVTLLVAFCIAAILTLILMWKIMIDEQKEETEGDQSEIAGIQMVSDGPCCSVCKIPGEYEVCLECGRKHRREIQRVRTQNWRAKKAGEPATLTIAEWLEILEAFHFQCAYCQVGPYELMEHYIPIGQGKTTGGTTEKNCVPACYKCNTGKSNKHPEK